MRKLTICTIGVMAALFALAPTAGADPPTREFIPASDFTISGSCSFEVGVHFLTNNGYGITFANGTTLTTGSIKVTLTNLSNPENSITLNIPGPGLISVTTDGGLTIDTRGPWVIFYPGVLVYTTGHSIFTVSSSGAFSLTQIGGITTDLCAALA